MKKALIYLILSAISISASSKTVDDILAEFSKAPHAESVNLGKFVWSLMKIANVGDGDSEISKKISSISILDLDDCSKETKLQFANQIEDLEMNGYQLLMRVKDDSDNVLIMSKSKKDKIKEFIIITVNDPAIIRLKGDFKLNDLADVANKYGEKNRN